MSDSQNGAPSEAESSPWEGSAAPSEAAAVESADAVPKPIVGIGASAGGIDAVQRFFRELPAETGIAFVVVLHHSPDRESSLVGILQHYTAMPVRGAADGTEVEADHVYVIAPGEHLELEGHVLRVTSTNGSRDSSTVDRFFRSLAADQGGNAVGIVLSGSGSYGTLGLRRINETGGVVFAQDPADAEVDAMPQSAVDTGLVDLVAPAEMLAGKLVSYRNHAGAIEVPAKVENLDEEGLSIFQKILDRLHAATGHDFSNYEHSMVLRRLGRRLQLNADHSLDEYLRRLRNDDEEARALHKDLLVGVTSFFRDAEAFAALEEKVIPELFEGKGPEDRVRVWVPGCATGEEAYSIAILLQEYADTLDEPPEMQVFATDVDNEALRVGRDRLYPEAIAADLTNERLQRFFEPDGKYYRVDRRLREMILFSRHNVLTDPPFSTLDLVSCRNLLVYLDPEANEHVYSRLHYGFRDNGFLFLGRKETAQGAERLFSMVDEDNNILQARPRSAEEATYPSFASRPVGDTNVPTPHLTGAVDQPEAQAGPSDPENVHRRVLTETVVGILVNDNREIVHLSDRASRYLRLEKGAPGRSLFAVVPDALRPELQTAMYQVFQKGETVERTGLLVPIDGETRSLRLFVQPVAHEKGQRLAHVRIDEQPQADRGAPRSSEDREKSEDLQSEHDRSREQLQTTTEEYEAAREEAETSEDQLRSINKELQALNEELQTTNRELKARIDEVRETNSVLENLLDATNIATLFLNRDLEIQRYTPRITEIFNVEPSDVGRPLSDFTQRFDYENLLDDAQTVLDDLESIEREIHRSDDQWFLLRVRPYRTVEGKIEGVVLTFIDITSRRRTEEALRESEARLNAFLEQLPLGAGIVDEEGNWLLKNPTLDRHVPERLPSQMPSEHKRWHLRDADGTPLEPEDWPGQRALRGETVSPGMDALHVTEDGVERWVRVSATPFRRQNGEIRGAIIVVEDIHDRKHAERALRRSEEFHRLTVEAGEVGTWVVDLESGDCAVSPQMTEILAYDPDEYLVAPNGPEYEHWQQVLPQEAWMELIYPDDRSMVKQAIAESRETGESFELEFRIQQDDGPVRWLFSHGEVTRDGPRDGPSLRGASIDISEQKQTQEELRRERNFVDRVLDTVGALVVVFDRQGRVLRVNDECEAVTGYSADELRGTEWIERLVPFEERAEVWEVFIALRSGEAPIQIENHIRTKDGEQRLVEWTSTVLRDGTDEVQFIIGTGVDVTERRALEQEVIGAGERVRREIGQDLHDVLSSDLAALAMKADNLKHRITDELIERKEATEALQDLVDGIRQSAEQSRTLSHALIPAALQEEHLAAALENLCREQEELTGVSFTFEGDREKRLHRNDETAMHLYRIAHEALTNVRRHAQADNVWVSLRRDGGQLVMTVTDDGVGLPDDLDDNDGIGLRTMDYRANMIGASLSFESGEEGGTVVRCTLPLDKARSE